MQKIIDDFFDNIKKHRKTLLISLGVAFTIGIIIMVFASIWDLKVSNTLTNHNNAFIRFVYKFGEVPFCLLMLSFPYSLSVCMYKHKKYCFAAITVLLALLFGYWYSTRWISNIGLNMLFNIATAIAMVSLFYWIKQDMLSKILIISFIAVMTSIISNASVIVIKIFWGRVRFNDLCDYNTFTNWWIPSLSSPHKSFPSGHVSVSTTVCVLTLTPLFFCKRRKILAGLCFTLPILYTIVMAFSRIASGKHFLSDVTFSVMLCLSVIAFVIFILSFANKIYKKKKCS